MKRLILVVLFLAAFLATANLLLIAQPGIRYDDMGAKRINGVTPYLPFDASGLFPWEIEDLLVAWFQLDSKASIYTEGWNADFRIPNEYLTERVQLAAIRKDATEFNDVPEDRLTTTVVEFLLSRYGQALNKTPAQFRYPAACLKAFQNDSTAWLYVPESLRDNPAFQKKFDEIKTHLRASPPPLPNGLLREMLTQLPHWWFFSGPCEMSQPLLGGNNTVYVM